MKTPTRPEERRTLTTPDGIAALEVRDEGNRPVATGYAATFNRLSQDLGGFVERVAPGAFAKTIKEQDVRALFNHEPTLLLGRLGAETLRLEEDSKGLRYEVDLPKTTTGKDVQELLRRRDVVGSSFGFRTLPDGDEWGVTEQGFPLRTLKAVMLRDVGPVTFPAYTSSEAALRSLAEARSMDLTIVTEAAASGDLRTLIDGDGETSTPGATHVLVLPTALRRW